MTIKRIKSVHVPQQIKGIKKGPWFKKSRYLEDRAISRLINFTLQGAQNVLRLPIDIQKDLTLRHYLGTFDGWKIYVKG